jgi:hypothetical protein
MSSKGFGKPSFKYAGRLKPGNRGPTLTVPSEIGRPDYAIDGIPKVIYR